MTDDLSAALAEISERNEGRIRAMAYTEYTVEHDVAEGDVRRLLAVVDALLKPHQPTRNVMYEGEVCPECRDEYGDPVPFGDCRARKAALGKLKGESDG